MEGELRQAVFEAAERDEVRRAVGRVYDAVGQAIASRRPICTTSGRCCRFEEYGHRLYVSTLELAAFVAGVLETREKATLVEESPTGMTSGAERSLPVLRESGGAASWNGLGCPFQIDGLCSVHAIRPFGCRIYFCDATSTAWQHEQYEIFHGELRRLHDALGVPYHYVEWRFALQELGL